MVYSQNEINETLSMKAAYDLVLVCITLMLCSNVRVFHHNSVHRLQTFSHFVVTLVFLD